MQLAPMYVATSENAVYGDDVSLAQYLMRYTSHSTGELYYRSSFAQGQRGLDDIN